MITLNAGILLWAGSLSIVVLTVLCLVASNSLQPAWTVACQVPLSMEFSMQEHWSGSPVLPSGDLPDLGIKPTSPTLAARFFTSKPPGRLLALCMFFFFYQGTYHYIL